MSGVYNLDDARELLRTPDFPPATLDAIHLAIAEGAGCDGLASGDRNLLRAADQRGLAIHSFVP